MPKCPKCGAEIDHLRCFISGWKEREFKIEDGSGQLGEDDGNFIPSEVNDNTYECPECNKPLFTVEGEAVAFLKGEPAPTPTTVHQMTVKDYIYCEECKGFEDFWKFRRENKTEKEALDACGHFGHNWRFVTEEELAQCIKDCEERIAYCPECDSILNLPCEKCDHCDWIVVPAKVVYRNCFEQV